MPVIVHVVFFVLKTVEVPQLQYLDKVVDVFFVQFIDRCGRPCDLAETWFAFLDKVVDMPVVFNDRCLGLTVQKTVESAVPVLTWWSMSLFVQVVVWVSCWRCLRLSSSRELVDIPVRTETVAAMLGWAFFALLRLSRS